MPVINNIPPAESAVVAELRRIEARDGVLRPSVVVQEAADAASALHPKFEWDDSVAAHQHRLAQARQLIQVTVVRLSNDSRPVRAYIHVPSVDGTEGYYKAAARVAVEPQEFTRARAELARQLRGVMRTLRDLESAARAAGLAVPEVVVGATNGIQEAYEALVNTSDN